MSTIADSLIRIIYYLGQIGLVDLDELSRLISYLNRKMFICTDQKIDYNRLAEALNEGPVLMECTRQRMYMAVKYLRRKLGEPVYRVMVGRKSMPIYLLYREPDRDVALEILRQIRGGGGESREG